MKTEDSKLEAQQEQLNIPKCNRCNDTGKIKYLPISFAMYSWQKYEERDCRCKLIM